MQTDHVFVVDDDPTALYVTARALRSDGLSPHCYRGASDALAAARELPPAVVVSDYLMPGMDGIQFLKQLKSVRPDSVRILCTGVGEFDVAMHAVNAGEVFRILPKPLSIPDLRSTVQAALETSRLRRENARLTAEVQRHNAELRALNTNLEQMVRDRTEGLLAGLAGALDYRDNETQRHSRRVSRYAGRLAAQLGISGDERVAVEQGALLHDLGKIGVPDAILRKPASLTPEEWKEMRKHPAKGWALIRRVQYLRPAALVVLHHHERWDGTGYPQGLRGEDISLGARVFHVVDTLDAITSDRPYRKGQPYAAARDEIFACAGTQFDPRIVAAFLEVPESDWRAIRDEIEADPSFEQDCEVA